MSPLICKYVAASGFVLTKEHAARLWYKTDEGARCTTLVQNGPARQRGQGPTQRRRGADETAGKAPSKQPLLPTSLRAHGQARRVSGRPLLCSRRPFLGSQCASIARRRFFEHVHVRERVQVFGMPLVQQPVVALAQPKHQEMMPQGVHAIQHSRVGPYFLLMLPHTKCLSWGCTH